MMHEKEPVAILAALCDADSRLIKVLRDDLKIGSTFAQGQPFSSIIDPQNRAEAENFLNDIRQHNASFGYTLLVHTADYRNKLLFVGGLVTDTILIIASPSDSSAMTALFEEMMRIINEQTNQLRNALKERSLLERQPEDREKETLIYTDLTRLNNELIKTQRELAKRNHELAAERERYRMISESISDFAYAMCADEAFNLRFEWTAGALEQITGYNAGELEKMGGLQAITIAEDLHMLEDQNKKLQRGEKAAVEVRIMRRDGSVGWLRDHKKPLWDAEAKRVDRIYGAMQDISEQKRMEDALISSRKMSDLGTLTAGIAHEISSPLQVITGIGDSLLEKVKQDQPDKEHAVNQLAFLARNAWRIADIVAALRNYAGVPERSYERRDLNEIVRETVLLMGHQFERQQPIEVVNELSPVPLIIECEYSQIVQALINLINNAQEAMPDGGRITLRTAEISGDLPILLEISDTGEGIAWENQEKVFNPFFTTKPPGQAKGLGLWIVAGIVQSHGGRIEMQSTPGKGSTFRLLFPKEMPEALKFELSRRDSGRFSD
ncbi:MAG: PAS domain S-box protein [Anaerolineae bacterium]|nr:PAS domain S-box protein [Anaerolineae bacterium]